VTHPGTGHIDSITDYAAGEVVDITQILNVSAGTNVLSAGFLRVTTSGLIQIDMNGGGNDWVTLSTVNGSGAVTVKYLSGGTAATLAVARVADAQSALAATLVAADNSHPLLDSSEWQAPSPEHFGSHLAFGETLFL
jgi:hypothetical protein